MPNGDGFQYVQKLYEEELAKAQLKNAVIIALHNNIAHVEIIDCVDDALRKDYDK